MTQRAFRITAEAASEPGRQWIRLGLDARDASVESIDSLAANLRAPVAICDPENTCDIPNRGQPARGWIEELEKRETLFGCELWGKASWIDIELAQACADGTLWCRTVVDRAALDPKSAYPIGKKLMGVEIVPTPFPVTFARKKETETMTDSNTTTTTTTLLAALPRFRKDSPNDCIALERAARELLTEAKNMAHQDLYRDIVHPAIVALGAQKFVAASSRAGATVRASIASSEAVATSKVDPTKPVLDVSRYVGEPTQFAKIMRHVATLNPGLKHDDVHQLASTLSRSHTIVG